MIQENRKVDGVPRQELIHVLIENIHRVIRGMASDGGFPFGEVELSRPHVGILFFIARKQDGASVKELAAALNVTSGAISQFVDRLIQKDMVLREEDPNDRRSLRIKLTKSANSRFEAFKKTYFESITPMFGELSDKDIRQFISLLEKIRST